jgi:hypothetical protein
MLIQYSGTFLFIIYIDADFAYTDSKVRRIPIQDVPGGKFSILGGHRIGHSKKKIINK